MCAVKIASGAHTFNEWEQFFTLYNTRIDSLCAFYSIHIYTARNIIIIYIDRSFTDSFHLYILYVSLIYTPRLLPPTVCMASTVLFLDTVIFNSFKWDAHLYIYDDRFVFPHLQWKVLSKKSHWPSFQYCGPKMTNKNETNKLLTLPVKWFSFSFDSESQTH